MSNMIKSDTYILKDIKTFKKRLPEIYEALKVLYKYSRQTGNPLVKWAYYNNIKFCIEQNKRNSASACKDTITISSNFLDSIKLPGILGHELLHTVQHQHHNFHEHAQNAATTHYTNFIALSHALERAAYSTQARIMMEIYQQGYKKTYDSQKILMGYFDKSLNGRTSEQALDQATKTVFDIYLQSFTKDIYVIKYLQRYINALDKYNPSISIPQNNKETLQHIFNASCLPNGRSLIGSKENLLDCELDDDFIFGQDTPFSNKRTLIRQAFEYVYMHYLIKKHGYNSYEHKCHYRHLEQDNNPYKDLLLLKIKNERKKNLAHIKGFSIFDAMNKLASIEIPEQIELNFETPQPKKKKLKLN